LGDVLGEVGDELDGVGAAGVGTIVAAKLDILDAALQSLCLVGESRDNATTGSAVTVEVQVAEFGRLIGAVDPVPGGRVTAFRLATVRICPCGDAAETTLSLGLENLANDLLGLGGEELLGSETDLVVNCECGCQSCCVVGEVEVLQARCAL
jgi:hypothetical protein